MRGAQILALELLKYVSNFFLTKNGWFMVTNLILRVPF